MDLVAIAINSLWSGLFASGLGALLTAPPRYAVRTFLCGCAGRLARDVLTGWGVGQNWATTVAATVVVLVGVAIIRERRVPPVVLVSGVLPLGAAKAMFNAILQLMRVTSLEGEPLVAASIALSASVATVFTTSLAIAMGLAAGISAVRLVRREKVLARV
ncbi:MAG: threonine/serine exporter family protein [Thermoanaerobaculaceae bacterium]|jgi:uncharacterized membrane protein YjjB (DUF3815 family)|nr:threonine/serine exporter family protein [Thermoanaerobaculaceae bacterium]